MQLAIRYIYICSAIMHQTYIIWTITMPLQLSLLASKSYSSLVSLLCRSSVLLPNTGTADAAWLWPMASTWCSLGIGQWPTGMHRLGEEPTSHSSNSPGSQSQEYWHAVEGCCGSSSEHWRVQVGRLCLQSARLAMTGHGYMYSKTDVVLPPSYATTNICCELCAIRSLAITCFITCVINPILHS